MKNIRLRRVQGVFPEGIILNMIFFLVMVFTIGSVAASGSSAAEIPEPHHLVLQDMSGESHLLHEYMHKNKWLVVMVWQSDCHVCNQEVEDYNAWYEKNKSGNSTVLGISTDGWENKEAAQEFLDKHKVTFPSVLVSYDILNDYYRKNTGKFFIGTPSFLVYSPAGELMAAEVGAVPTDVLDKYIKDNSKS